MSHFTRALNAVAAVVLAVAVTTPSEAVVSAGNGFYQIYVTDVAAGNEGVGQYTATTGPLHPAGDGLNVLFGYGSPWSSFNTIRSYSSSTDYVQTPQTNLTSSFSVQTLDSYGTVMPLGTTGYRTTYVLPGPPTTPDQLTIIQDVRVNGTTFSNSTIEVTTTISNTGPTLVRAGVRYFWDYQIWNDDGPTFQPVSFFQNFTAGCDTRIKEAQFPLPTFDAYRIEDNDVNPAPPTFNIFGTVNGPSTITPAPTRPDLLQYLGWGRGYGTAFEFTVDPTLTVAVAGQINDSAVNYYFGHDNASALSIGPGDAVTVSASIYLTPLPPPPVLNCITRDSRFWFTHASNGDPNCVNLLKAIQVNCDSLSLGFLSLPMGYHDNNNVLDAEDALVEALGLYWKSANKTGELGGTQNQKLPASQLCRARKQLAIQLVAAIANKQLLGTQPNACSYVNSSHVLTNFPVDLIDQAINTLGGETMTDILNTTDLVRGFNLSGVTNDFPLGYYECSTGPNRTLKKIARDPTTRDTCPGRNDSCGTAEAISSFPFKRSVNTSTYGLSSVADVTSSNAFSGHLVWYKITPDVGRPTRRFTANTGGSNFDTMLSVWRGTCDAVVGNSLSMVTNNDNNGVSLQSRVQFSTDGTNTYFIVISSGSRGGHGKAKISVTSP